MSDWTREKTLLLIEKIKKSNVWDSTNKKFKRNKTARNNIYAQIGTELNIPPHLVKRKWECIRSQYRRELVRMNAKSDGESENVYISNWYALPALEFLKDQNQDILNKIKDEMAIKINVSYDSNASTPEPPESPEPIIEEENDNSSSTITQSAYGRKKRPQDDVSQFSKHVDTVGEKRSQDDTLQFVKHVEAVGENLINQNRSLPDEFSVFGEYIANELRHLNDSKYALILAETKNKINTALYHAELKRIRLNSEATKTNGRTKNGNRYERVIIPDNELNNCHSSFDSEN